MVIQTISKRYKVIQTLLAGKELEAYLCRDADTAGEERFLILGLTGDGLSKNMIPYFMELSRKREASDFLDCFIKNGSLWLVFPYFAYTPLAEKMKEPFLQSERLEASRTLMERILSQNLPWYLQYEALAMDNLTVSDTCEVYCNYLLRETQLFETCHLENVCSRLADIFKVLFSWELEEQTSRELELFIKGLRECSYGSYTEIYRDYKALYEILVKLQSEGQLKPRGWLLRMWERFKVFLKKLKRILSIALLVGLVGFLLYVCIKPADLPAGRLEFDKIGTLELTVSGK